MEDKFNLIPDEVKLKTYELDPDYEYSEITMTAVQISIFQENAKQLPEMTDDDPRKQKIMQLVDYIEVYLPSQGWVCYEIAREGGLRERRRFRRLKQKPVKQSLLQKLITAIFGPRV